MSANLRFKHFNKIMTYKLVTVTQNRRTEKIFVMTQTVNLYPFVNRSVVRPPVENCIFGLVIGQSVKIYNRHIENFRNCFFRRKIYNIFRRLFHFYRRKSCKIRPRQNYQKRFIINFLNFAVLQKNNLFCQQEFRIFPIEMPCL